MLAGGDGVERLALLDEDLRVLHQQVLALHAGPARLGADQKRVIGVLERNLRVPGAGHAGQQRKRRILELHHHSLHRGLRLVHGQLEQLEDDRLVLAQHLPCRNAEQQGISDLAGGTGDCNADGFFHGGLRGRER